MVREASQLAALDFTTEEQSSLLNELNNTMARAEEIHRMSLPNEAPSPIQFNPRVPGTALPRIRQVFRPGKPDSVQRPANLESVAFWPITQLAELIRTRKVSAVELTEMYLARLRRYNPKLNCVVTLTSERALEQAGQLDRETANGRYRGLLHGIPWGAKDIIAARGYPTTWGAEPFDKQLIDEDATVVKRLVDAGAILVAKLSTGELAFGDQWHCGRTNNPWNPAEGSSGSSAGSGSATAAGLVSFAIGTDTGGSILAPSSRCGVVGLRPTFGRVSRHGVMAAGWTLDKIGPMCRYAEDCAIVLHAIAGSDGLDLAVPEGIPFAWDAEEKLNGRKAGYIPALIDAETDADIRSSYDRAITALKTAGCRLQPVDVPRSDLNFYIEYTERAAGFDEFTRGRKDKGLRSAARPGQLRAYHLVSAVDYLQANRARLQLMKEYERATREVDFVVGGRPSGRDLSINPITSMTGHPAVSVPTGFNPNGTPASVVLTGRLYEEGRLLLAARVIEASSGIHDRHPALD
jgi:Asp-tRNA(Asn)/Glu-tRNA(Gln) amidotransferase A subunit family amidase